MFSGEGIICLGIALLLFAACGLILTVIEVIVCFVDGSNDERITGIAVSLIAFNLFLAASSIAFKQGFAKAIAEDLDNGYTLYVDEINVDNTHIDVADYEDFTINNDEKTIYASSK